MKLPIIITVACISAVSLFSQITNQVLLVTGPNPPGIIGSGFIDIDRVFITNIDIDRVFITNSLAPGGITNLIVIYDGKATLTIITNK